MSVVTFALSSSRWHEDRPWCCNTSHIKRYWRGPDWLQTLKHLIVVSWWLYDYFFMLNKYIIFIYIFFQTPNHHYIRKSDWTLVKRDDHNKKELTFNQDETSIYLKVKQRNNNHPQRLIWNSCPDRKDDAIRMITRAQHQKRTWLLFHASCQKEKTCKIIFARRTTWWMVRRIWWHEMIVNDNCWWLFRRFLIQIEDLQRSNFNWNQTGKSLPVFGSQAEGNSFAF